MLTGQFLYPRRCKNSSTSFRFLEGSTVFLRSLAISRKRSNFGSNWYRESLGRKVYCNGFEPFSVIFQFGHDHVKTLWNKRQRNLLGMQKPFISKSKSCTSHPENGCYQNWGNRKLQTIKNLKFAKPKQPTKATPPKQSNKAQKSPEGRWELGTRGTRKHEFDLIGHL